MPPEPISKEPNYPVYRAAGAGYVMPANQKDGHLIIEESLSNKGRKSAVDARFLEHVPGAETMLHGEKTWLRKHWGRFYTMMRRPNYYTVFHEADRNALYFNRHTVWTPLNRLFQSLWGDKDNATERALINDLTSFHDYSITHYITKQKHEFCSLTRILGMVSVDPQLLIHGLPESNFAEIFKKRSSAAIQTLFPAYIKPQDVAKAIRQIDYKAKWYSPGRISRFFQDIKSPVFFAIKAKLVNHIPFIKLPRLFSEKCYFSRALLEITAAQAKVIQAAENLERKLLLQQFLSASEYDRLNNDRLSFQQDNELEATDPLSVGENIIPVTFETSKHALNLCGILQDNSKLQMALKNFETTLGRWEKNLDQTRYQKLSLSTDGRKDSTFDRIKALQQYTAEVGKYLTINQEALLKTTGTSFLKSICIGKASRQVLVRSADVTKQMNQSMPQLDNVSNRRACQRDAVDLNRQSIFREFLERPSEGVDGKPRGLDKEPIIPFLSGEHGIFNQGKQVMQAADRLEQVTTVPAFKADHANSESSARVSADLLNSLNKQLQNLSQSVPETDAQNYDYSKHPVQTQQLLEAFQKNIIRAVFNQAKARLHDPKFAPNSLMTKYKLRKIINTPSFIGNRILWVFKDYEKDILLSAIAQTMIDFTIKELKQGTPELSQLNRQQLINLFDTPEINKLAFEIVKKFKKLDIYPHEYVTWDAHITRERETFSKYDPRLGRFYTFFEEQIKEMREAYAALHPQVGPPQKSHEINHALWGTMTVPGANDAQTRIESHLPFLEKGIGKPVTTILGDLTCAHRSWRRRLFPFSAADHKEFSATLLQNLADALLPAQLTTAAASSTPPNAHVATSARNETVPDARPANNSSAISSGMSSEEKWFRHNLTSHFPLDPEQVTPALFDPETCAATHVEFAGAVNLLYSKQIRPDQQPRQYARPLTFMNGVNLKKFIVTSGNHQSSRYGLALNRNNYLNIINFVQNQKKYGESLGFPCSEGRVGFINNQPYLVFTELPRTLMGLAPEPPSDWRDETSSDPRFPDLASVLARDSNFRQIYNHQIATSEEKNNFLKAGNQLVKQIKNSMLLYLSRSSIDAQGNPDLTLIPYFPKNVNELEFFIFKQVDIFIEQYFPRSTSDQLSNNYFDIVNTLYKSVLKVTRAHFEVFSKDNNTDAVLRQKLELFREEWDREAMAGHSAGMLSPDRQDELTMHANNLISPSALGVPTLLDSYLNADKTADILIQALRERAEIYSEKSPAKQYTAAVLPTLLTMIKIGMESTSSHRESVAPELQTHYDLQDACINRSKKLEEAIIAIGKEADSKEANGSPQFSIEDLLAKTREALIKYLSFDSEVTVRFRGQLKDAIIKFETINTVDKTFNTSVDYSSVPPEQRGIYPGEKYQAIVVELAKTKFGASKQVGAKDFLKEIDRLAIAANAEIGSSNITYTFERLLELTYAAVEKFLTPVTIEGFLVSQEYQHMVAFHEENETYHDWLQAPRKISHPRGLDLSATRASEAKVRPVLKKPARLYYVREVKDNQQLAAESKEFNASIQHKMDSNKARMLAVTPRTTAFIRAQALFDLAHDTAVYTSKQKDFVLLESNLIKAQNLQMIVSSAINAAGDINAPNWENVDEDAFFHIIATAENLARELFANHETMLPGMRPRNPYLQKSSARYTDPKKIIAMLQRISDPNYKNQRITLLNELKMFFLAEEKAIEQKANELDYKLLEIIPDATNAFVRHENGEAYLRLRPPALRIKITDLAENKIDMLLVSELHVPPELNAPANDLGQEDVLDSSSNEIEELTIKADAVDFAAYLRKDSLMMDDDLKIEAFEQLHALNEKAIESLTFG